MTDLNNVMESLLAENGCPWDKVQTHETLKNYLIEESYEVVEAIDNKDSENLCEELGDVLFQIIFHSKLAERENKFDFSIKDFYDLTGKEVYFDYVLEKQLKEYQNECETLNRSCRNLNDEKEKLFRKTKELSNLVLEYKNSTSWKVTRPLRKISSCFRK